MNCYRTKTYCSTRILVTLIRKRNLFSSSLKACMTIKQYRLWKTPFIIVIINIRGVIPTNQNSKDIIDL